MIQDSLVGYISSQLKLGVSREAIKAALMGSGWGSADVEETLKVVEGRIKTTPVTQPAAQASSPAVSSAMSAKPAETQSIRVSDLVSASASAGPATSKVAVASSMPREMADMKPMMAATAMSAVGEKKRWSFKSMAMIGVIIILAGATGYLAYANMDLSSKAGALSKTSAGVAGDIASLNGQIASLSTANSDLTGKVADLTQENEILKNVLSFVAAPAGASTTAFVVTMSGKLTSGSSYILTTPYGVAVYVKNSKDAKVVAALAPYVASSTVVNLTGEHLAGSPFMTVTAVNGTELNPPPAVTSTTASTTPAAASTTPGAPKTATTTAPPPQALPE